MRFIDTGIRYEFAKNTLTKLKNLLQNHSANFRQTWQNASLGDVDSSSNEGPHLFSKGDYNKKPKYIDKIFLLQNHLANFNQTWHNASLDEEFSSLFQ